MERRGLHRVAAALPVAATAGSGDGGRGPEAAGRGPCGAGFGRSRRHPHRWRAQRFECRGRRDVHIAARRPPSPFGCTAFRVVFAWRPDDAHRCNSQRYEWSPQQDIHIGIGRFLRSRVRSPCKCTGVRVIGEAGYPHRKPASFIECGWHLMDNARRCGRCKSAPPPLASRRSPSKCTALRVASEAGYPHARVRSSGDRQAAFVAGNACLAESPKPAATAGQPRCIDVARDRAATLTFRVHRVSSERGCRISTSMQLPSVDRAAARCDSRQGIVHRGGQSTEARCFRRNRLPVIFRARAARGMRVSM